MITLITGAPGAGKTAEMVALLLAEYKDRMLYVHGLNGLTLDHQPLDVLRWHETVPDGALIVVDEAQTAWRPRGPSQQALPSVQALETHRHRGIDFLLTTQQPRLVDANVRALVGRHLHFRDTGWLGRWRYEWPECSENLAWKSCPVKGKHRLPVKAFEYYKSASLHVKPVRGRSPWWKLGALALMCIGVMGYLLSQSSFFRSETPKLPEAGKPSQTFAMASQSGSGRSAGPVTAQGIKTSFQPRLVTAPETAPAYDDLRQVVRMRRVVGGFCRVGECRCVDQDGNTVLVGKQCYDWLLAPPFDPYRVPAAPTHPYGYEGGTQASATRAQMAQAPRQ